jgi:hypothetical protein
MGATARVWVITVKDETDNVVHLSHANAKRSDKVEAGFLAPLAGKFVLSHGVVAGDLGNGGEEEMGAVWKPVANY